MDGQSVELIEQVCASLDAEHNTPKRTRTKAWPQVSNFADITSIGFLDNAERYERLEMAADGIARLSRHFRDDLYCAWLPPARVIDADGHSTEQLGDGAAVALGPVSGVQHAEDFEQHQGDGSNLKVTALICIAVAGWHRSLSAQKVQSARTPPLL